MSLWIGYGKLVARHERRLGFLKPKHQQRPMIADCYASWHKWTVKGYLVTLVPIGIDCVSYGTVGLLVVNKWDQPLSECDIVGSRINLIIQ